MYTLQLPFAGQAEVSLLRPMSLQHRQPHEGYAEECMNKPDPIPMDMQRGSDAT